MNSPSLHCSSPSPLPQRRTAGLSSLPPCPLLPPHQCCTLPSSPRWKNGWSDEEPSPSAAAAAGDAHLSCPAPPTPHSQSPESGLDSGSGGKKSKHEDSVCDYQCVTAASTRDKITVSWKASWRYRKILVTTWPVTRERHRWSRSLNKTSTTKCGVSFTDLLRAHVLPYRHVDVCEVQRYIGHRRCPLCISGCCSHNASYARAGPEVKPRLRT